MNYLNNNVPLENYKELINTTLGEIRDLVSIYIFMKICGAFTISIDFVNYMQILLLGIFMVFGYLIFSRQEVK